MSKSRQKNHKALTLPTESCDAKNSSNNRRAGSMHGHERRDIYQEVTDMILTKLDQGTVPWRYPIKRAGGQGWPKNLESGKKYRGINVFLLSCATWEHGYTSDYWLTYKQAQAMQGQVRKGEKSSLVFFWKQATTEDKDTGDEITIPVLRHYNVFNAEQCEGITPPDAVKEETPPDPFIPIERAEQVVSNYKNPPVIEHKGSRAVYRPSLDKVEIAPPESFMEHTEYYSTLFHELSHSTGHSARLNRGLDTELAAFGSPDYGKEELIAEMSAAFLCAAAGISPPTIDQAAAYIDNWRKVLKGDKRLVINAASAAQRSADWILGETFAEVAQSDDINAKLTEQVSEPKREDIPLSPKM